MSDFYKRFLMEDVPRATPGTTKQVFLGAFGKHPGWDDHVEDLGLETGSLVEAKKLFYVQGIGGEIDAGAWEKLDDSQRLPAFKHLFVWQRPGQYLIGRLWSSSDGKGRTRYPMVVCAHCSGVSLAWALDQVIPRLEQIEAVCITTQSAEDVRGILNRHRADLRASAAGQTTELGPPTLDTASITKFAARPEFGVQHEGWMRVLYSVQSQFGAFARGKFNPKSVSSVLRPQQIRVPRAADSVLKSILQWSGFFLTQVDPQTPMLLTVPLEEQWLDVTVGEPSSQELFGLRATPKAMPLASEVPYTLSDEFRAQARQVLAALEIGRPPASIFSDAAAPAAAPSGSTAPRGRFFKWFGGGAVLLILMVVAIAVSFQKKPDGPAHAGNGRPEATSSEVVAAARPPAEKSAPTPVPADVPAAALAAEKERQAAEKRMVEEKAKSEATARLKALADEQEKVRLAAEAETRRQVQEKQLTVAERSTPEKRVTETATAELARVNPGTVRPADKPAAARPVSQPPAGVRERTNTIGMVFVAVPGGYWAGKQEVTQAQFEKIMGRNPSGVRDPAHPVENVNWEDAQDFCRKLTSHEMTAGGLLQGWAYALPSEAQWNEFVADADLSTAVSSLQKKRSATEPAGSAPANRLGLHDVRGNVWEWCLSTNDQKVVRGGAYDTIKGFAAASQPPDFWKFPAEQRRPQVGFRCVLLQQQ